MGHFTSHRGTSRNASNGGSYSSLSSTGTQPAKSTRKKREDQALFPRGTRQKREDSEPRNASMYGTSCFTKSSPSSSSLRAFSSPTSEAQRKMAFLGESAVPCAACSGRHQPTNSARKGRSANGVPDVLWLLCSSCSERRPGSTTSFQGVYEGLVISGKGFHSSVSAMRNTDSGTKLRQLRKGPSAPMPLPHTKMWSRPPVRLK
mmetsp:Transcript_125777/g.367592  ORF Transcript_125777/g.367592 Transcript_125777/m.367592 type:complete len:204 (-) Transcript_125777:931-1542(-)